MQIEQVAIAGHEHVRAAVDGSLEELVVLRITRRANRRQYIDDFAARSYRLVDSLDSVEVPKSDGLSGTLVSMTTRSRVIVSE